MCYWCCLTGVGPVLPSVVLQYYDIAANHSNVRHHRIRTSCSAREAVHRTVLYTAMKLVTNRFTCAIALTPVQ
jgi:hypothetical protein